MISGTEMIRLLTMEQVDAELRRGPYLRYEDWAGGKRDHKPEEVTEAGATSC